MRFVIDSRYVTKRASGIGTYVEALVQRLPALAPDEQFLTWASPERPVPVKAENVSHEVVSASADGLRTLLWPTLLGRLHTDDVVHFSHSLMGRGLPCASVVTIHDLMWLQQPHLVDGRPLIRRVRQRYYQLGMRWALEHATRILAVSHATAASIAAIAPEAMDRVRVTPNAVRADFCPGQDETTVCEDAARILGHPHPYFVVVGKNEPYKGHAFALRAFAASAQADDHLVLVQRANPGRGLHRLAQQLGIADRIEWKAELTLNQLVSLLRGAKALLQPSLHEGFGIPVLEAMACGCPVVASDTPALLEVMAGAGLHAAMGQVSPLAAAMMKLRDPVFHAELSAKGLARAADFSWDDTAAATLEVYREAAAVGPN